MKILRRILWIALLLLFLLVFAAFSYYFAVTKDVALLPEKLVLSEKTVLLYDGKGERIKNVSALSLKQTVRIEDIPAHTKQAFVDIEDKRFYEHNGFDFKRIAGATLHNLAARSFKEGASTISQQLIKNTHLTQEKTLKRKLREWKLTRALEKSYTKAEILEKYLNTIYFGHGCFGITAAAEFYFNKSPSELSLADSAILAGLVKAPNHYSPFKNPEKCNKRKAVVLKAMQDNGSISKREKDEALNTPLPTQNENRKQNGYMQAVFDELTAIAEEKGFSIGGSLEIRTYLDPDLQEKLEGLAQTQTDCDKAMLVLDNETRGFKACVSTVGNIRRLPGSLIKPLLVYTPALEENILVPATPILDEKVNYRGYSPENYDGVCHGYVSARECVEKSLNIPAVKVLDSLGVKKSIQYMQKIGLPVEKEDESLALALGGMKNGYTLRDIARAYSTLANDGVYGECGFISSVKVNGVTVYVKPSAKTRVFSSESSYLMTDMLKSTAKNGTAKKLRTLPLDIAAKTGTVGTAKGNTDAYALSYTTRDCISVWLGNADNRFIEHTGGGLPCNFLLHINEYLYNRYTENSESVSEFKKPAGIVLAALDKTAYYDTHTMSLADELAPAEYRISELFKKSAIPLNKSDSFTNPAISSPRLILENGCAVITLDERSPCYYRYKILRTNYATHTTKTVYEGGYFPSFTDEPLPADTTYIYTVIPVYQDRVGKAVVLPAVSTAKGESPPAEDNKILEKEWWKY